MQLILREWEWAIHVYTLLCLRMVFHLHCKQIIPGRYLIVYRVPLDR